MFHQTIRQVGGKTKRLQVSLQALSVPWRNIWSLFIKLTVMLLQLHTFGKVGWTGDIKPDHPVMKSDP
jgi:hypothetical protein